MNYQLELDKIINEIEARKAGWPPKLLIHGAVHHVVAMF